MFHWDFFRLKLAIEFRESDQTENKPAVQPWINLDIIAHSKLKLKPKVNVERESRVVAISDIFFRP